MIKVGFILDANEDISAKCQNNHMLIELTIQLIDGFLNKG